MFAYVLQEAGVLPEVLPLVGETLRQSFGKRLMPLRKGETVVADDDLVEAVGVHALPRQVKQVKIGEDTVQRLQDAGRIMELRAYNTVYGVWKYFTVDDEQINLNKYNYLYIVTLEGYTKIQEYFGADRVVPIYIEVEDGERLMRAIAREQKQDVPKYEEMCRRFLADSADFCDEKLVEAGVVRRFSNNDFVQTVQEVTAYIADEIAAG